MLTLRYTPKALDDLQDIKTYIALQFGTDRAGTILKQITTSAKQLEKFPKEGPRLEGLIDYPTEYRYLVVRKNYIIYRIEGEIVKVIRILNENQDFMQILFGISSISDEGERYWSQFDDE